MRLGWRCARRRRGCRRRRCSGSSISGSPGPMAETGSRGGRATALLSASSFALQILGHLALATHVPRAFACMISEGLQEEFLVAHISTWLVEVSTPDHLIDVALQRQARLSEWSLFFVASLDSSIAFKSIHILCVRILIVSQASNDVAHRRVIGKEDPAERFLDITVLCNFPCVPLKVLLEQLVRVFSRAVEVTSPDHTVHGRGERVARTLPRPCSCYICDIGLDASVVGKALKELFVWV
mmetsp:Transcript_40834/g.87687  ORF Transcript_40834/g.87687 Transcript_40834/m.87687 type:complete len:240 (-) Transcript_40834:26-745(-)